MRWRTQNLSTEEYRDEHGYRRERPVAGIWRNSRGWLTWGEQEEPYKRGSTIGVQWKVGRPLYRLGFIVNVDRDNDEPVHLVAYLWPFSLYVNIESRAASWLAKRVGTDTYDDRDRELSLKVSSRYDRWVIRWHLWYRDHVWGSDDPRWRRGSVDLADVLLGRNDHSSVDLELHQVEIPLPEGPMPASIRLFRSTWRRRRFGWPVRSLVRAEIKATGRPAVVPGKGENSWDCDDDAILGLTTPAKSVPEAIAAYVEAVLEKRLRHGGSIMWQPVEQESK